MDETGILARAALPAQGSPLSHGAVGFLDELALMACIVFAAVVIVTFYIWQLRKSKTDK